ncbi:(-)-germacrene d synthase [Quercus suber]|uniref:(-)-germacrene d synthase n=1 Tax=Quercus suber TaxID=58331 RepID=A0AAW0K3F3_QUESU|nr:(-)-germacrene d synthase [Quercus suber]
MAQHGGTEEEEAINEFQEVEQVKDAWKDINKECLYPTIVPAPTLTRILNLAHVIDVVYKDKDGYTHARIMLEQRFRNFNAH